MNSASPVILEEQQVTTQENNIVQNYLRIPLIEIEQLNPRIRQLNGGMKVKYWATGGEEDGVVEYDYEWVGGEISFIPNPYPRVPMGTGLVAWIQDDSLDPVEDNRVRTPDSSLSGEPFGWNRELLASHYGDCFWRIVDEDIDKDIRDRYRKILVNILTKQAEDDGEVLNDRALKAIREKADEMVQKAVDIQHNGNTAGQRVIVRARTPGKISERIVADDSDLHNKQDNEEIKKLLDENYLLKKKLEQAEAAKSGEVSEEKKKMFAEKTKKMRTVKKEKKIEQESPQAEGNLGG